MGILEAVLQSFAETDAQFHDRSAVMRFIKSGVLAPCASSKNLALVTNNVLFVVSIFSHSRQI